jgi:hypothetical protein
MTPCYGSHVMAAYAESILRLQVAFQQKGIGFAYKWRGNDALITRARAEMVAAFLADPTATHLMFIDADIAFQPEQALRLLAFNKDVVAAAYPLKGIDWKGATRAAVAGRPPQSAALKYVVGWAEPERIAGHHGFTQVRYAGTGFILIRRQVLVRLCNAHPELKYRRVNSANDQLVDSAHRFALFDCIIDPETGEYLSEDFAFCRRWTDLGGEIWLDLESRLTHYGQYAFIGDLMNILAPMTVPSEESN